jgi:predicted transcriptional regulator
VSDLSQELRLKVDDDLHRKVHAIAMAAGEDAASWMRHVLKDAVDAEIRKHTLLARLLRGEVGAVE